MRYLILVIVLLLPACSFISERPATSQLVVRYATLKYIDGDQVKADRVVNRIDQISAIVENEEVTISVLESRVRENIKWETLDQADRELVNALITEVGNSFRREIGDGVLDPNDKVQVLHVFEWIRQAANDVN